MRSAFEKIAACVLAASAVAWGGWQAMALGSQSRWFAAQRGGPGAILDFGTQDSLRSLEAKRGYADTLAKDIFPPDHERAADLYSQALAQDPLSSELWHRLAREQVLLGRSEFAKASLDRSDQLDPHYPEQRYEAINLWTLLGEPERGARLARRLADLGGSFRQDAARRLNESGMTLASVFRALGCDRLPPEERLGVVAAMLRGRPATQDELAQLFETANLAELANPADLSTAAKLASDPLLYDVAVGIWKRYSPGIQMVGGVIPADNLDLGRTPLSERFHYGWQPLDNWVEPESRWVRPDKTDLFEIPHLQLVFHQGRAKTNFAWRFYRLALPPETGAAFQVSIRLRPAERSECRVTLVVDGKPVQNAEASTINENWQRLDLSCEPAPSARVVELTLGRAERMAGMAAGQSASVLIGALKIEPKISAKGGVTP